MKRFSGVTGALLGSLMAGMVGAQNTTTPALPGMAAWSDRRPVAQFFISQEQFRTLQNPGGYLNRDVNALTAAGREAFRQTLLASADKWIPIMKEINGQGMIVWDLEGFEQSSMVYVGDPRVLPWYAPYMSEVADEFFQKFRDAGLRTGLCIRPNKIFLIPPDAVAKWGKWGYLIYDDRKDDVVWELSQRIAYAQKRWGCTLFYMDTNGYDTWASGKEKHEVLPDWMLKQLHTQFPDVLIIPEHYREGYPAYCAQYRELRGGHTGTPAADRGKYPGAFSVLQIGGGEEDMAEANWDALAESVKQGDALFATGWYPSETNELVKRLYRQAEYLKKALPAGTDLKSAAALLKLTADADPAVRFLAVRALREVAGPETVDPLLTLLAKDQDWLVQAEAMVVLGKLKDPRAIPALLPFVRNTTWGHRFFALRALSAMGPKALPSAQELAAGENRNQRADAARLASEIGGADAVTLLCKLLQDQAWEVKLAAAKALEKAPGPQAVAPLIKLLETETNWTMQLPALRALGKIGDPAAKDVLTRFSKIELTDGGVQNRLRSAAAQALKQMP